MYISNIYIYIYPIYIYIYIYPIYLPYIYLSHIDLSFCNPLYPIFISPLSCDLKLQATHCPAILWFVPVGEQNRRSDPTDGRLGKAGPAMGKASGKMIYKWWLEKTSLAMENGCVRDLSLEHLVEWIDIDFGKLHISSHIPMKNLKVAHHIPPIAGRRTVLCSCKERRLK